MLEKVLKIKDKNIKPSSNQIFKDAKHVGIMHVQRMKARLPNTQDFSK